MIYSFYFMNFTKAFHVSRRQELLMSMINLERFTMKGSSYMRKRDYNTINYWWLYLLYAYASDENRESRTFLYRSRWSTLCWDAKLRSVTNRKLFRKLRFSIGKLSHYCYGPQDTNFIVKKCVYRFYFKPLTIELFCINQKIPP